MYIYICHAKTAIEQQSSSQADLKTVHNCHQPWASGPAAPEVHKTTAQNAEPSKALKITGWWARVGSESVIKHSWYKGAADSLKPFVQ